MCLATGAPALGEGSDVAWGIRPADGEQGNARDNFRYEAVPGETVHDALRVTNRGAAELELQVYGADGTSSASGQIELEPAGEVPTGVGAWLAPAAPRIVLAPGESIELAFTLAVPADADAGDHVGGIVTSSLAPGEDPAVAVDRRLASSVVVRVAAEVRETPSATGDAMAPWRTAAVLAVLGLLVAAVVTWRVVLRGRATG